MSFFLPASPSLDILSSDGIAMVRSWITMDAVIYGEIESANSVALENASPERILKYANRLWVSPNAVWSIAEFIKGTGITEPSL